MTTRGLKEQEFIEIGNIIVSALKNYNNEKIMNDLKEQILNLMKKFPLEIEGYNE